MTSISQLATRRQRLADTVKILQDVKKDVARDGEAGKRAATAAAVWASILMVCEILKTTVSAADPKAAVGFNVLDTAVEKADRLLQLFGSRPMVKKADLMKQVDPNLLQGAQVIGYLRTAQGKIKEVTKKVPVLNLTRESAKQIDLVATIALDMGESTILLMQAGQMQNQIGSQTAHAHSQIDRQIAHLTQQIMKIDREIDYSLSRYMTLQNTA